ncbi:MAG: TIR domain-containing protein [Hyphomicrobium sp.]|jgi:hypothetical protein
MTGEIFISYRRDDSAGTTGRIYDRIIRAFPREKVFMDVDAAMHGLDFVRVLDEKIAASDLVAVVIGPSWLTAKDSSGRRRIDNPHDFVRIEVGAALKREIPVIPVLIDGAEMPGEADLPPDLKALSRRHAVEVRNTRFGDDADTLVEALAQRLGVAKRRKWVMPAVATAGLVVTATIVAGTVWGWTMPIRLPDFGLASITGPAVKAEKLMADKKAIEAEAQAKVKAEDDRKAQAAAEDARKAKEARELRERIARMEAEARIRAEFEERRRQEIAAEARARAEADERRRQEERTRAEADERRRQEERTRAEAEAAERQRQQQAPAPAAVDIASLPICERLWHQRNSIFHSFGYCFATGKGLLVFGNTNCSRDQDQTWLAMGESNRELIKRIKEQESANGC